MTATFEKIASITVGSGGSANATFSSIPQTYTDLKLVANGRVSQSANQTNPGIAFNGSTSTFTYGFISGTGTGYGYSSGSSNPINDVNAANSTSNLFTNFDIYIPNYANSSNKPFIINSAQENNASNAYVELWGMLWSTGAAITSISLTSGSTWVEGSTFHLYGIKNS